MDIGDDPYADLDGAEVDNLEVLENLRIESNCIAKTKAGARHESNRQIFTSSTY